MKTLDPRAVVRAIRSVLPDSPGPVALHEPTFSGKEWEYVKDCLNTGWVSSAGPHVERFEAQLAQFTGAGHVIAVVNGTAALHISLLLAGVESDDEVLVPTLTFVATANAVAYCGATPHFVDSDEQTLGVDHAKLERYLSTATTVDERRCVNRETGRPIRALIVVHTFGHPADLEGLRGVCDRFGLVLVEDATESLGSYYRGRHTGTVGRVSALSFNGNKVVTTGGGGAILTDDIGLAETARHLTTTAKRPHPWAFIHDQVGYNYRLPDLNAALGCAQLEALPQLLRQKRALAGAYQGAFSTFDGVVLYREPHYARSNYWLNALVLHPDLAGRRDEVLAAAHDERILARPPWTPMHMLPMFTHCPRMDVATAEDLASRLINIPSSTFLAPQYDDVGETTR